ncbi:MAG: hypothetical protein ACI4PW_05260 [Alphaproteobacteria bacterium]|jgi:hypothetical protein|nr:MAG TPA: hypothetical protein [Caudoviricetes sp.]
METMHEGGSWKERLFSRRRRMKKALKTIEAYKSVFSSADGQAVLEDLAAKCHMLDPVTDISDPGGFTAASAFYDGKRAAFLDIVKMLGFRESRLIELLKETEGNRDE